MKEQKGVIAHWNDQKGFGFISSPQGEKHFFHISAVRGAFRPLQGETVWFQAGSDTQGRLTATHVRSENLTIDNPDIRIKPGSGAVKTSQPKTYSSKKKYLREHKIPWLLLAFLLVLPALGILSVIKTYSAVWVFVAYVFVSLMTYYFYWDDKRRAQRNEWRIPEANLHFWSLVGGWPGAFVAQQQFRHKTKKYSFLAVFWLIVIAHQVLWFDWVFMDGNLLLSIVRSSSLAS